MKCGYRFEDDELVDEMLAEVEGERGALPLLAFAMARLWEQRDRENGLLTRQAYRDIGGVGGALARHAEETIDRIGSGRVPIVRELFRNLVTAEGTRAVRAWDELLSIFDAAGRHDAEEVLRELVNARLLTSYEVQEEDREPTRRVEIIHESLLANWPRLVRWQTQDADAVQLRDQLRQAARTWDERSRADDLLWTGSAYREFASWRERYPGGLSETEEAFADAMMVLVTSRRRRRRLAIGAVMASLLVGLTVISFFWRRSAWEARKAEAANLLMLARVVEFDEHPTARLAHAIASLELVDSEGARLLALEALWKGPTAFVVNQVPSWEIAFTPDGQHLVQTTDVPPHRIHVIGVDGSDVELEEDPHDGRTHLAMDPSSGLFATRPQMPTGSWALWSAPERRLVAQEHHEDFSGRVVAHDLDRRRMLVLRGDRISIDEVRFDETPERLGTLPFEVRSHCWETSNGSWFAVSDGGSVYEITYGQRGLLEPRRLDHLEGRVTHLACDPLERFVAARYDTGEIRLADRDGTSPPTVMQGPPSAWEWFFGIFFELDGSFLYAGELDEVLATTTAWIWSLDDRDATLVRRMDLGKFGGTGFWALNPVERQLVSLVNPDPKIRLWPLGVPADAAPVILQRGDVGVNFRAAIDPTGRWLASSGESGLSFWPIARPYPTVLDRYQERVGSLVFGPEGRWLATSTIDNHGTVRLWRLEGDDLPPARVLHEVGGHAYGLAASPDGKQVLLATHSPEVLLLRVDGDPPRTLTAAGTGDAGYGTVAISRDGRLGAAYGKINDQTSRVIQVWDLHSLETVALFDLVDLGYSMWPSFTHDRHLLSSGKSGLLKWDLETGDSETVVQGATGEFATSADDSRILVVRGSEIVRGTIRGPVEVVDLESRTTTPLEAHGDSVTAVAMDGAGTIVVTGDEHGTIRVGPVTGEEPHLLVGRPEAIEDLAVDPKGRWIASSSGTEVRLWPIPDLSKPPLHTLPREELIAKLKTLTNLRVVRDEESTTGWALTHDPFPGWETVPTW
jgi:WD40 repeat protein